MSEHDRKWKSWGKRPNQAMRHQSDRDECPHCGYRDAPLSLMNSYIVGFSPETARLPNFHDPNNLCLGIVIKECPHCFECCTCHLYREGAERLARKALTKPEFFKIASARRALIAMLQEEANE